jgi:4-amino-4-deoxy-L-arabinose transferase-like glycosyltransferase
MRAALAVVVFGAFLGLDSWRTGGALHDGDEAIYAEMAREMARGSGLGEPKWQDHPVLNRPPAAVWVLAAAVRLFGDGDRVVRAVASVEMALAAALLFVFAALRYDKRVALAAALLFGASDLVVMYARYFESEPLLLVFVLAACVCWQKRWMVGFGVCLAGALMTKQIVGALPLLLPAVDRDARGLARALLVAAALALPWHLYAWIRFGHAFPAAFLWHNLVVRSTQAMHDRTTAAFYFVTLWRHEGALLVLAALGLVFAALRRDFLPAAWTLAVLAPFSLAASRYDYYALLAIPALALGSARIVCDGVPRLRGGLAAAVVIVAFVHVLPRVRVLDVGPYEMRTLAELARHLGRPDDTVMVFDQLPYTARYYGDRYTLDVSTDRTQYDEAMALAQVLPIEITFAPAPEVAARFPRWFAIAHKSQLERLGGLRKVSHPVARTQNFVLFTNVDGPG